MSRKYKPRHRLTLNYNLVCPNCKNEFYSKSINRKFCSKECSLQYKYPKENKELKIISCQFCSCLFEKSNTRRKYCSQECRKSYSNGKRLIPGN